MNFQFYIKILIFNIYHMIEHQMKLYHFMDISRNLIFDFKNHILLYHYNYLIEILYHL